MSNIQTEQEQEEVLRNIAAEKLREAETAWYKFACALPLGSRRDRAFDVYENVRNAARVG